MNPVLHCTQQLCVLHGEGRNSQATPRKQHNTSLNSHVSRLHPASSRDEVQSAAAVACRQLGFDDGIFQSVSSVPANVTLLPAWAARIRCVGTEASITECEPLNYGDTETCGLTRRLVCSNSDDTDGAGSGVFLASARFC